MRQDLTHAVRALLRAPSFAVTAILTLALAIAVNTIVFTLLNSLALRPMPVRDAASVVRIFPIDADGRRQNLFSYSDYRTLSTSSPWSPGSPGLAGLAAYIPVAVTAAERDGVREVLAYAVSASYFPLLGIQPSFGRSFTAAEEHDRDARVVVISHALWIRDFGGAGDVIGRQTTINGHRFDVIGVGPETFMGTEPLDPDFWVPLSAQQLVSPGPDRLRDPDADWLLVVGRLAPGVRPRAMQDALSMVASRAVVAGSAAHRPRAVAVVPATFFHAGPELRPVIGLVLAIVGLVLIIACANIANLVLTRAAVRQRELAIRVALGAGAWRMARHLLAESLILAAAGGVAGLLLSAWTLRALYPIGISLLPFRWARVVLDVTPDVRVFAYTLVLSALAGLAFGLAPLVHSSTRAVAAGLRDQASLFGLSLRGPRIRRALVVVQITVCVMLLAAAALATRSLQRTRTLDVGFVPTGVVHTSADLPRHGYGEASAAELHRQLIVRVRAIPEVRDVALTTHVPLTGGIRRVALTPEGHDTAKPVICTFTSITPGYFRTLGISFVAGRDFSEEETAGAAPVAIISAALARRFWPGGEALGRRVTVTDAAVPVTIVGVVRDAADASIWREKGISLYVPASAAATPNLRLLVRTDGDARALAALLRAEARRIDPRLRFDAEPLDEVLALWMLPSRVAAIAGSVLGAIALATAAVGIYGVMAYGIAQRRREIAVRVALGATRQDVRTLLLNDGGRLIATGLIAGVLGAMIMMRAIATVLPGAVAADPIALAAALVVLTIAAVWACYLPARSASEWDPLPALRSE